VSSRGLCILHLDTNKPRVNVGGKLDIVCFDKTGTLTEDGLDVLGARIVTRGKGFSELLSETSEGFLLPPSTANSAYDIEKQKKIVYTMATCHSLRVVDDELLGDPLDVKMFQFTNWTFEEGGNHVSDQTSPKYDTITPSVARPPPSGQQGVNVSCCCPNRSLHYTSDTHRTPWNLEYYGALNLFPSFAAQVSLSDNLVIMVQTSSSRVPQKASRTSVFLEPVSVISTCKPAPLICFLQFRRTMKIS